MSLSEMKAVSSQPKKLQMAKCCVEVGAVPYNCRYVSAGWVVVVHAVSVAIKVVNTSFVAIANARNVMHLNLVQRRLGVK